MARERRALYPPVLSPRSRPSCPASGVQEPAARVSNPTLTLIGPFGGLLPPFRALGRVIGANGADRAAQDALASAQCPYRHGYQIFRGRNEPASQQLGWVVGPFRSFPVRLPHLPCLCFKKIFPHLCGSLVFFLFLFPSGSSNYLRRRPPIPEAIWDPQATTERKPPRRRKTVSVVVPSVSALLFTIAFLPGSVSLLLNACRWFGFRMSLLYSKQT